MKTLLKSALVVCAIVAVSADARCPQRRGGCSRRPTTRYFAAKNAVARNRGLVRSQTPAPQPVIRGGCSNGSCSL